MDQLCITQLGSQRWSAMATCLCSLVVVAALDHVSQAADVPFTGIVVPEKVDLRAGAGMKRYMTGNLKKGELVKVEQVIYGWYKITPPASVYSFISKGFVDVRGDGSAGLTNRVRCPVMAANVQNRGESYVTQVRLDKGTRLEILGAYGSFYLIAPPKGAFVYAPPTAVRRATKDEIRMASHTKQDKLQSAADEQQMDSKVVRDVVSQPQVSDLIVEEPEMESAVATIKQVGLEPLRLTPMVPIKSETVPLVSGGQSGLDNNVNQDATVDPGSISPHPKSQERPVNTTLVDMEVRFASLSRLPLETQPLDQLHGDYQALKRQAALTPNEHDLVVKRLEQLQLRTTLADTLSKITRLDQQVDAVAMQAVALDHRQGTATPPPKDQYIGRLLTSGVYDGRRLPRFYRLVEPGTGRTIAYLRPGPAIDPKPQLGKLVVVRGPMHWDKALKLRIIKPQRSELAALGTP